MNANENNLELTEDEKEALAEGLKESAQLLFDMDELEKLYQDLSQKYPLKSKGSKYR